MSAYSNGIKDQVVQYPNRFKINGVSQTIEPDFGVVTEPGTPVNRELITELLAAKGTTAGTAAALTLAQPGFALTDGAVVRIKLHTDIAADATLNIQGTGAKAIKTPAGGVYPSGAVAGAWLSLIYSAAAGAYVSVADRSNVVLVVGESFDSDFTASVLPEKKGWRVAYGKDIFIATGYNAMAVSTNGYKWRTVTPISANSWAIAFGADKFVAVSVGAALSAQSTDGSGWAMSTMPSSATWGVPAYGNGRFVTVAENSNKAAYSTDGITWVASTLPANVGWLSIAYGNGRFVAVSDSSTAAYSADGATWTSVTMPSGADGFYVVVFGLGMFIVGGRSGKVFWSGDGVTWTEATVPVATSIWRSGAFGHGVFVLAPHEGAGAIYSFDGLTWAAATLPSLARWSGVAAGNKRFVAVTSNSSNDSDKAACSAIFSVLADTEGNVINVRGG